MGLYKITGSVAGSRFFSRAASTLLLSDCILHVVSPEICLLGLEIIKKRMQNIAHVYVNRKQGPVWFMLLICFKSSFDLKLSFSSAGILIFLHLLYKSDFSQRGKRIKFVLRNFLPCYFYWGKSIPSVRFSSVNTMSSSQDSAWRFCLNY